LLGILVFLGFTAAGVGIANVLIGFKSTLAMMLTTLADTSNTTILIAVTGVFAFIGLMIGLSLFMQGLTYNKVCKIAKRRRRKDI
jgi:hypothetical protein